MKEFEKLWNAGMLSGSPSSFTPNPPAKTIALFAWKAALEWTLSIAQEDSFDFLHNWEKGVSEEDKKIISPRGIKKELEDE